MNRRIDAKTVYACARITDTDGNVYYSTIVPYSPEDYTKGRINASNPKPLLIEATKNMVMYGEYATIYFNTK